MIKIRIDEEGNRFYYNESGELHNDEGPAIEYKNGDVVYYINGKRNCYDGPAVIKSNNGGFAYYKNDKLDRDNGPALINNSVKEPWCVKIEYAIKGKKHNLYGPAAIYNNGHKLYCINGREYSSFIKYIKNIIKYKRRQNG